MFFDLSTLFGEIGKHNRNLYNKSIVDLSDFCIVLKEAIR